LVHLNPWKEKLSRFLQEAGKVAVLGVGNEIRADDGAGTCVARLVAKALAKRDAHTLVVPCIGVPGGSAPENFTGIILRFSPTHLIVVDAFFQGGLPGEISEIPECQIQGLSLSSHKMPLGVLRDFFRAEGIRNILFLGIEPRSIQFGRKMSPEVRRSAAELARTILALIG